MVSLCRPINIIAATKLFTRCVTRCWHDSKKCANKTERLVMACLADFANTAANDGTFDATNAQAWSDFALEAAHNAPQVWLNAIQVAKTQAIKNKLILFMTAIPVVAAGIKTYKYNIPQEGAGAPTVSIPPQPSSTTSTTKCDPSQPKNQNSVS